MTPGELDSLIAERLGRPKASITNVARVLRDGRIVAAGGRGRSSRHVTMREAATLLLATAASVQNVDAVEVVRKYGSAAAFIEADTDFFGFLPTAPSGLDVVEAVMTAFADGEMERRLRDLRVDDDTFADAVSLQFQLNGSAWMQLQVNSRRLSMRVICEPHGPEMSYGMKEMRYIHGQALSEIARAVRPESLVRQGFQSLKMAAE